MRVSCRFILARWSWGAGSWEGGVTLLALLAVWDACAC